jgi:hypothetical protein
MTAWSASEAPSTSHGQTTYAYPAHYYQQDQQQQQQQHQQHQQHQQLPDQPPLYTQQEESYDDHDDDGDGDDDDESDDGDVFAFGPPSTGDKDPQPHQMHYSQQQKQQQQQQQQLQQQQLMSQNEHLSAAQLHNLVAAAGLSPAASGPLSGSVLSSIPEFPTAPNSLSSHAHAHANAHDQPSQPSHPNHPNHLPETASSYEYEPAGPNSYSMQPIPVSPTGITDPQHQHQQHQQQITPNLDSITYSHPAREPVQVALPTTADSYDSSLHFPAPLKPPTSDPNTSALDLGSQTLSMSYKYTDIDPADDEEDSPYTEVRASVSNMDDPEMPTTTFRMWLLGLTLCLAGATLNIFFNFRYPAPYILPSVILLLAYPLGKALAYLLPIRKWVLPRILGGGTFTLNPGPFNVKEHVLIYMMANVAIMPAYIINAIVVAESYYGLEFGAGFEVLLTLATMLTGFGLAGVCRKFLVTPASMVWPQNLVSCTLLNTFHAEDDTDGKSGISRFRFFFYVLIGAFFWNFLPSFLFIGLSFFSWVCWIAPSQFYLSFFIFHFVLPPLP